MKKKKRKVKQIQNDFHMPLIQLMMESALGAASYKIIQILSDSYKSYNS